MRTEIADMDCARIQVEIFNKCTVQKELLLKDFSGPATSTQSTTTTTTANCTGFMEACLAGAGNTGRVTQQADRTELYWGWQDKNVVQGQDLNYWTRRQMPVYVWCDLCDNMIRCYEFHFFLYCTTLLVHVTHVHCLISLILLLSDSPRFCMTCSDSYGCATIMHDSYGLLVTRSLSHTDQWLQYKYGRILKHVF